MEWESSLRPGVSRHILSFSWMACFQVGLTMVVALALGPEFYVAAAIAFFKALKVYPAPHELIMIYQKTQPQAVFELVMELVTLE